MRTKRGLILLLLLAAVAPVRGEEPSMFPFVLPWDDASASITSAAALNPTPAGAGGFIRPKDGHFVDEKGRRMRFLGVNFTFGANFTDHESARKVAAHMHKYGINVVRLHHMDYFAAPNGIFDPRYKDTQHLDASQLDRLDFLIAQLKQYGIYVNINLHVSRHFNAADGFAEADKLSGKVVNFFEPRMIELQKKYARDLLTHRNPYTKTRYVEEPAVAFVELTNENTLLGAAWDGTLDSLPRPYQRELQTQWNAWLKKRYDEMPALRRAWKAGQAERGPNLLRPLAAESVAPWVLETHQRARGTAERVAEGGPPDVDGAHLRLKVTKPGEGWHVQLRQAGLDLRDGETYTASFWARADRKRSLNVSASLDVDDWHNVGLNSRQNIEPRWQRIQIVFTVSRARKDHNRLVFACGDGEGVVELAGLSLRSGAEGALPKDVSLEMANVPLGRPADNPAGRDWIAFLVDTERHYLETMTNYLKKDLHLRANVCGSQASYGGLGGALRESRADYTDMHNYWEHPRFPHRPWDPADWLIRNTPMTRDRFGGTLKGLARYRLAGKPFTVSEYNHPAPNDYQAECVPMLAAFAAFQDWDGIYLFDYHDAADRWDSDRIRNFFSIHSNPAKMTLLPAAATMFLRGDLGPAPEETRLEIPQQSVIELLARNGPDIGSAWNATGGVWPEALRRRVSVAFAPDGKGPPSVTRRRASESGGKSGLSWRGVGTDQALFTADSPHSKLVVGLLGGQKVALDGWRVEVTGKPPAFAALALTAKEDRPIARSRSLLLTAVGRVENRGMTWNADRTSVGKQWGEGPSLAEGVSATIKLDTPASKATVHALDGTGKRRKQVDTRLADGVLTFTIGPEHKTLWYEIETNAP
jgi:hypothetical protein